MPDLTPEVLFSGFVWYVVFLFSTTCHEASHALAAKIGGDPTAALGGQVSLNPIPHIRRSFFGMVVFPLLSFFAWGGMIGWASAPYDPLWERRHPRRSGWMALAGPAANFTLMLLAVALLRAGTAFQLFPSEPFAGGQPHPVEWVLQIVFLLNLLLGTFNLLPVPPLDGSSGILVFMGERTAQNYLDLVRGSNYAIAGLLVASLVFGRIFPYIKDAAINFFF